MRNARVSIQRFIGACLLLLLCVGALPSVVDAASCTCFCTSPSGADEQDGVFDEVGDCVERCELQNAQIISCAATYGQYPQANLRCFSASRCADANGTLSNDTYNHQPPECPQGWGYCYANQEPYQLAVGFGDVETVVGVSGYIAQAYRYLLGISVTIAIVFVMIGGLQYVLSAGSGQVGQAKQRIGNALAGLVLLLFAYVILYTVNPNLTSLRLPALPMIRQVALVGDASCEKLDDEGFEIGTGEEVQDAKANKGADEVCGSSTIVKTDPEGNPVADGTLCNFADCSHKGDDKVCYSTGTSAKCVKCTDVYAGSEAAQGLTPTSSVCAGLTQPNTFINNDPDQPHMWHQCFFSGALQGATAEDPTAVCVELAIDCTNVNTCGDYDSLEPDLPWVPNYDLELWASTEEVNLETICRADPCKAAQKQGGTRCAYSVVLLGLSSDCRLAQ